MNGVWATLARIGMLALATTTMSGCLFDLLSPNPHGMDFSTGQSGAVFVPSPVHLQGCSQSTVPPGTKMTQCNVFGFTSTFATQGNFIEEVFDPLIVQIPADSGVFGTAAQCGMFFGAYSCFQLGSLDVQHGLASIAIDATHTLVAEPGMQLAIVDLPTNLPPAAKPPGSYQFNLRWAKPAASVKVLFAAKVVAGGTTYYPPILPCVTDMASVAAVPATGKLSIDDIMAILASMTPCHGTVFDFENGAQPAAVDVIEFYHAGLDHYFITWVPDEIAALDAGTRIKGWTRTGRKFKAYSNAVAGSSQVCRFYIPPGFGDSHFFGRGQQECDDTARKFPQLVLEDPQFMYLFLPANGACPAGLVEVHRAFSNRADANHRYFTDPAVGAQMQGLGWVLEGDGPNLVVMCAPA